MLFTLIQKRGISQLTRKITKTVSTILLLIASNAAFNAEKISLQDSINLALRENPSVKNVKLAETLQKFSLEVAEWQFKPHFNFTADASTDGVAAGPQASLLTPIGTEIKVSPTDFNSHHFKEKLSIKVSQPLLRGFGRAIVEASLYDARDNEKIAKLNIESTLRTTVTNVVNAYLDVVAAEKNIEIDTAALKRAEDSVRQTKLFIKSGRKAGNELITVEANVATAKASLENNKNALSQVRFGLLNAIGLDPNQAFEFSELNIKALINKYHFLQLEEVKKLSIENDIQYQIDKITINGVQKRALMIAEDNARPRLNFEYERSHGDNASLSLTIPIDDKPAQLSILSAKIGLEQARINLQNEKWTKEVGAISNWKTVVASKRALKFAEDAATLQQKTYQLSYQKYLHGLIDSLELQTAQFQLIESQHSLLAAEISYLKSLVNLDLLIGHTLKTWNIEARLQ